MTNTCTSPASAYAENTPTVDPWHMQRTLMAASGQSLPAQPELNRDVLLYAALNMEELSETIFGLVRALDKLEQPMPAIKGIATQLAHAAEGMLQGSGSVRELLAQVPADFKAPVSEEDLMEMADGTTDVTVTNSGFALALGLDGGACYNEVAGSNLSKINPDTGVIDKTPDGKWIKGRNYRAPNLRKVVLKD